jgi:hypothetical protein
LDPLVPTRTARPTQEAIAACARAAVLCGAAALALSLSGCGQVSGPGAAAGATSSAPAGPLTLPTEELATELGCPDDTPVAVGQRLDLPTRKPAAVVVAHCQSAAGSPPDGVYVVGRTGDTSRVTGTLVAAADQVDVTTVVRTGDRVEVTGRSYSGPDVPRCCPDVRVDRAWRLDGDHLVPVG